MTEPLSMPEVIEPTSRNGRPMSTHDRACFGGHGECITLGTVCLQCGCCFGCDDDCCAEYTCPNPDCGCSDKPQPTYALGEVTA